MVLPNDKAVSWPTQNAAAAPAWQPGAPGAAGPDDAPDAELPAAPGIEVLEADDLLGIGPGSDILIVDDDAGSLEAYEAALAPLGRRMVAAQSGIAALARLLEQDFALV